MNPQTFARTTIASALMMVVGSTFTVPVAEAAQIEEVIVTAQKREQSSQEVGAAITAVGGDELIKTNVNNIQDLQNMAPSLQIGETFGFASVVVRGIGTDNPFAGGDPSVAMHIDGVVVGQSSAQFGSLFDIERVEVLRGPQGTLYGRNATGGSVNVITHRPTEELSGYVRASVGNYDLTKIEAAIGGSLADNVMGRIAVRSVDRGGYGENIADGSDIDDADQQSLRGQLLWNMSNSMDLRLAVESHREDDTNYMPKFRAPSYGESPPLPQLEAQPASGVRASDPRDLNSNVDLQNERDQSSYTLEYNWDINDTFSMTSVINYQDFDKTPQADFDMTDEDFYIWSESFDTKQKSAELRLNFDTEKMHGILGAFYYNEEISNDTRLDLDLVPQVVVDNVNPNLAGCSFDDNLSDNVLGEDNLSVCIQNRGTSEADAFALFANVEYQLTDTLGLILGVRYSDEERSGFTDRFDTPGDPAVQYRDEKSFNRVSPNVKLQWHATDDAMVYASYSQGFKAGIFLTGKTTPVLDPEIVDAFELGLKGMFFDRQLQFNAAAFYYDFTDLQQGRSVPAGTSAFTLVFENAASAEILGAEMEFTWLATDNLQINGSATYLDATFEEYVTTDPFDTIYQLLGLLPAGDISQDLSGNSMVQSPEWAWTLGASYDFTLPATEWNAQATVSASFKDDVYFSQFNHEELGQEDVTTVNANILLTSPDEKWTVNAWGKNLTDETVYMGTFILNSSRTNAGFLAPPRTYGLTVGYSF